MFTSKVLLTFLDIFLIATGILGLIFYKRFKKWIVNLLFNRLNPFNLPQQPDAEKNFVLIAWMIFLIMYGLLGIWGRFF
jgi:hypothetical protein